MNGVKNLKDVLDYIDNGITDNNNKTHYILYISMIHIKQANLIITKLIDHENGELRDDYLKMRSLIVLALIEKNEELYDADRYFKSS